MPNEPIRSKVEKSAGPIAIPETNDTANRKQGATIKPNIENPDKKAGKESRNEI